MFSKLLGANTSVEFYQFWDSDCMAMNTSISLDDHFVTFLAEQVASGRYQTSIEDIRAGLRLLEEREVHLNALRAALIEGKDSGEAEEFDFDAFIDSKIS